MHSAIFYTFFGVCFTCFALRTLYHVLENRGSSLAGSKSLINALLVVMFFLWFSWFGMVFTDPFAISLPEAARYAGLALFAVGVLLFIASHLRIGGLDGNQLVTRGVYSKIRHPMYLGFMIWMIGLPLFLTALFTLASTALWIPHILYWTISEERGLARKHDDYQEYRKKTWF